MDPTSSGLERGGCYLGFHLGQEDFAFPAAKVREIMGRKASRDLAGSRLPLVDLRLVFGLPGAAFGACVIVLDIGADGASRRIGMVVDAVTDVLYLADRDIEEIPQIGGRAPASPYLSGMTRINGKLRTLLNVERVLGAQEPQSGFAWVQ